MSKLYVILGRAGDILCQLPMLHADYVATKEKPRLMVAKEFAPLLDGCSYVDRVVFDGDYKELGRAVALARGMSNEVVVTSLHGTAEDVEKFAYAQIGTKHATAENFQREAWKLAGREGDWDECLPLVFDQRDKERETFLLKANGFKAKGPKKPVILLAIDGGITAPFPYTQLLRELVTLKFGKDYRILDLPMVELDGRIYDLLALYEQAALLIAIDSMPLHLSWACPKLPVFALANDRPTLWHGSAWRPNHLWFCRYHDWPERAVEMCDVMSRIPVSDRTFQSPIVTVAPRRKQTASTWTMLDFTKGMGREAEGYPLLRDVIQKALQRGGAVVLERDNVRHTSSHLPPCYAYRIRKGQFHPIVDLFSAPKAFWKKLLPEIPDLIMDNGPQWSQALMVLFKKYGAVDATGCCEFVGESK